MSEGDLEFPEAPLSPSIPSDFLVPEAPATLSNAKSDQDKLRSTDAEPSRSPKKSTPKAASRQSSRTEPLNPEEERKCKEYSSKMIRWVDRARSKKHDSDRATKDRKHRLACVLAIDALVCFMIGFDYEDRSEAIRTQPPAASANASTPSSTAPTNHGNPVHARSWSTLIPYLAKLASSAESVDADLAGLYYQICAVVRLHVIYLQRRSVPPEESARNLYSALADFRRGLALLPLHILYNRYGFNEAAGWMQTKINQLKPDPLHNRATLPLHVNSSLSEAAAFAINVGRKWAEIEGIEYTWEAAKV